MKTGKSFFRKEIDEMDGYVPGEQPKDMKYIKLNTNENPYPPSPSVVKALRTFDASRLRLYPDPVFSELRKTAADIYRVPQENILAGNGSDDILTITVRAFAGKGDKIATLSPSYSLYPVLAQLQGCKCMKILLEAENDFSLPSDILDRAEGAKILFIARPNAPTGTAFALSQMRKICSKFKGIVFIDEAYADFSDDNCMAFAGNFPNVIIGRTLSKSYSLAGLRVGFAVATKEIISGMFKVKDSYNVGMLAQSLAIAALKDRKSFNKNICEIRRTRAFLSDGLRKKGFKVCASQSNFVFAAPPDGKAEALYRKLKQNGILVRYFRGSVTGNYVRITVGTGSEIKTLLKNIVNKQEA